MTRGCVALSRSNTVRSEVIRSLVDLCKEHDFREEIDLDGTIHASVTAGDQQTAYGREFVIVKLWVSTPPAFASVHEANFEVVGPARWIIDDGSLVVRVDLPPGATIPFIRHSVSHALELAGWPMKPLAPSSRDERFDNGLRRLTRSLDRLGIALGRLHRYESSVVVGFHEEWDRSSPKCLSREIVSPVTGPAAYCFLSLVEDRCGVVWLRASAASGAATREQVVEVSTLDSPMMIRHLFIDSPSDCSEGAEEGHVFSVSDLDLSDASPMAISWLVWSVATFAANWGQKKWSGEALLTIPAATLESSSSDQPLEVGYWTPPPVLLVGESARTGELDGRWGTEHDGSHDELCGFHTPLTANPTHLCDECDEAFRQGGEALLEALHERGVVTESEFDEIHAGLGPLVDPTLQRRADTRLRTRAAQRSPIKNLVAMGIDTCNAKLAEQVGIDNPSYRTGRAIIEMLVGDGLNEPILLVGPAGLGKSHLAEVIAKSVIDIPVHPVSLGGTAGRHTISGSDTGFKNPDRGVVVDGIVEFRTTQFLLVLDEIEKLAGHSADSFPLAAVLALFDDQRAKFTDWFVGSAPRWKIDLTDTVFIATANELGQLPEPVLSRMRVIEMSRWTRKEKLDLAQREVAKVEEKLDLEQPTAPHVLEFIVDGCPEPGIRELLRALKRYEMALRRSSRTRSEVDLLALFPPPPATPVADRLTSTPPTPGMYRSVVLGKSGWHEVRCTATPNGSRWVDSFGTLGVDVEVFVRHWVPALQTLLDTTLEPCTLHLFPTVAEPYQPTGLSLAMLAAVVSATTGLVCSDDVIAPLGADPLGRLSSIGLTAAEMAGLSQVGMETVAVAAAHEGHGLAWTRPDLPKLKVVSNLTDLMELLVPGQRQWTPPPNYDTRRGYL